VLHLSRKEAATNDLLVSRMSTRLEVPALPHDPNAWKLFVFRKSRESIPTQKLLASLEADIRATATRPAAVLDALVRAGEIETGLADAESPATKAMADVVDHLASAASCNQPVDPSRLQLFARVHLPAEITCSHPEGFSFYGLNPLDFADLARRMHADLRPTVAVIGIRSVGSTLGAVVAAVLRSLGTQAERITVRPGGAPYHRHAKFSPEQEDWIRAALVEGRDFVVVDEGPGFSGSTFLSVARALLATGVPGSRIVLMGSRPFATRSRAPEPDSEWSCLRQYTINYGSHRPPTADRGLGDGAWRELLYHDVSEWPACWLEQERTKHLSADRQTFFKFEGFARYGQLARQQTAVLAAEGFSPENLGCDQGYVAYEFVRGRPLTLRDLNRELLGRIAEYCALRARAFAAPNCDVPLLTSMARINLAIEFGAETQDLDLDIPVERPVYPDCRMLPHEWLLAGDGRVLKTDAVGHGDGHQFPGPADIAWDLAGVIVEWKLSASEAGFFLDEYRRRSGDHAAGRLAQYLILYAALRTAQCRMASASMGQSREARYLHRQYLGYSQYTRALLDNSFLSI
jgi:hypothetical protein